MRYTLQQILEAIASTVNQEASAPDTGSDDYLLWLNYINRSINEWERSNDWEELKTKYTTSSINGQTSMALPSDFEKLGDKPRISITGDSPNNDYKYRYIDTQDEYLLNSSDKYIEIGGNFTDGHYLSWNPALTSGLSVNITYYRSSNPMSSLGQYAVMDDPLFLVDRTIAYIYEARADSRFQVEEAKARSRLMTMVENSNLKKYNNHAGKRPIMNTLQKIGFRVGRD